MHFIEEKYYNYFSKKKSDEGRKTYELLSKFRHVFEI